MIHVVIGTESVVFGPEIFALSNFFLPGSQIFGRGLGHEIIGVRLRVFLVTLRLEGSLQFCRIPR
jgi:hypothetical protein